jgi:hypothetical protein
MTSKCKPFIPACLSLQISLSRFPKSHINKLGSINGAESDNWFKVFLLILIYATKIETLTDNGFALPLMTE